MQRRFHSNEPSVRRRAMAQAQGVRRTPAACKASRRRYARTSVGGHMSGSAAYAQVARDSEGRRLEGRNVRPLRLQVCLEAYATSWTLRHAGSKDELCAAARASGAGHRPVQEMAAQLHEKPEIQQRCAENPGSGQRRCMVAPRQERREDVKRGPPNLVRGSNAQLDVFHHRHRARSYCCLHARRSLSQNSDTPAPT